MIRQLDRYAAVRVHGAYTASQAGKWKVIRQLDRYAAVAFFVIALGEQHEAPLILP